MLRTDELIRRRWRTLVMSAAGVVAIATLTGCGVRVTSTQFVTPKDTSGYRVLSGAVPVPSLGTGESATPIGQFASAGQAMHPNVPSASGHWFMTSSATGFFRRTAKVELLATGHRGVRFNLYWQESCGGARVGRHGVLGGAGGAADLTLHVPALVLVKLPSRYGTYDMCYLAATVSMHMSDWKLAKAAAPTIKVIHY